MTTKQGRLKRELRQAGADAPEAEALSNLAVELALLKPTMGQAKQRWWTGAFKPLPVGVTALIVGAFIIVLAQSVSPTNVLYPVQKLSDAAVIKLDSQYRATVMMRRAQQVNELVARHASSSVILSTLTSYDSEATSYKSTSKDSYPAFEYCKANLEEAATNAPTDVRQAITNSLSSLNTT